MKYLVSSSPDSVIFRETPARFTWRPSEGEGLYSIAVYAVREPGSVTQAAVGTDGTEPVYKFSDIDTNYFTPDLVMPPGNYQWSLYKGAALLEERLSFTIREDAVATPLPSREQRYVKIPVSHPRIRLTAADIPELRTRITGDLASEWKDFLEKSADVWLDKEPHKEPDRYPNDIRVNTIWRAMYLSCQEMLYAVRHTAIAYQLTGEKKYLAAARAWLLEVTGWKLDGPTWRTYNDEAAFRVTGALAWGYDLLYDNLSGDERRLIRENLLARGRELFGYVTGKIRIQEVLLDSHGIRSVSMALVPAALALYGEEDDARRWLDFAIEYYMTMYPPWGGYDGGWAEGPAYWQMGISFALDALDCVEKATGLKIYERPFFQNTADYALNFYCRDLTRMAFCDMSDLGDRPGLKAGYNLRRLACTSKNPNRNFYSGYYEIAQKQAEQEGIGIIEKYFYNYGWWDFRFDDLLFKYRFTMPKSAGLPAGLSVKWFHDIDWVAVHSNMNNFDEHIAFMFKSSSYGAVSHSHGDQNGFVLHAFGEPLAIHSGYYIGFWSEMHVNWRRQTKSKNAILIDGAGQFAELKKKTKADELNGSGKSSFQALMDANGFIEEVREKDGNVYIRGNATQAYKPLTDSLIQYLRHVFFINQRYFIIVDELELSQPCAIDFLMHTLRKVAITENSFLYSGEKADMRVSFVAGGKMAITQSDEFTGVSEKEIAGLAKQWHIQATGGKAASHKLVTLIEIGKAGSLLKAESPDAVSFDYAGGKIV
ncbi:MAG: DUF4962 domain-containing protein, partial [Treponema sp.]|nr:DUF4962 domain-containing protein [Treponema sp.]